MSKILTSCTAKELTEKSVRYNTLAINQYRGRPGRTTTDNLHVLTTSVKNTWRSGEVVIGLFPDIESAFPSINHKTLIHDMRKQGVPKEYTDWMRKKLEDKEM